MHQFAANGYEMVTADEPTMSQKNDRTQCVRSLKNLISLGDAHGLDDCLGNLGAGGRSWLDAEDDVVVTDRLDVGLLRHALRRDHALVCGDGDGVEKNFF